MPEIVILSGKGGTGKTSITGAFAHLAENSILCDLDVDAPDLHLLLQPEHEREEEFFSGHEARIDTTLCEACGICMEMCRFGAITCENGIYAVDSSRCEGCKVCVHFCPARAIAFPTRHCGSWFVSGTRFGTMVHAQLFPGEENSGLLVSVLKRTAREIAKQTGKELILCDGAPGIGCPVISSLSGADLVIAVTEPTLSGRHDLERVAELTDHFKIPLAAIINKADINDEQSRLIEEFLRVKNYPLIARVPHDIEMTRAMVQGKVITEWESACNPILRTAWKTIMELAGEPAGT